MGKFNREDKGSRDFGGGRGAHDRQRGFGDKTMYRATCSDCGRSCEVPFRPTGDKPVYCSECFGAQGGSGYGRDSGRNFDRPRFEDKKMFSATCGQCGSRCEVPFRPIAGKEVFCNACFGKGGETKPSRQTMPNYQDNFKIINDKLDQIIKALNIDHAPKEIKTGLMTGIEDLLDDIKPVKKTKKTAKEKPAPKKKIAKKK